jgi:hypothetical protein
VTAEAQSSGAVLKTGLIWNDFLRDDISILKLSQTGTLLGIEVRLGAEENTYFKLGGYYAKMHMAVQAHPKETQFFKVKNGFDLLKATCGVETRLIATRNFNWRLAASGAFSFVAGVKGNVKFEDLNSGIFGVHFNTGVDISFVSIDLSLEPGLTDFIKDEEDTRPVMLMATLGFHF